MKVSTWLLKVKDNASSALGKIEAKSAKVYASFNKAQGSVDRWQRKVAVQSHKASQGIDRIKTSIGGLMPSLGGLKTLALGAFAAFGIQSAISGVINFGAEAQKARISYEVMLGSVEKGNALYAQLQEFANKTPFDNASVNKGAQTLLQFGTAGKDILPTLKMLGDVSAGDKQKFDSLTLAFGQMSSAGKLMGQDLLQMINAGFNPLQEMSKMTGQSMGQLKEAMSAGAISSQMVVKAFQNATSQGGQFNGMMDRMSNTFSGKMSTAMGKLQVLAIGLFERIEPYLVRFLNVAISGLDFLNSNMNGLKPVIMSVAAAVGVLAGGFAIWKAQMIGALAITKLVTAAQWLYNVALTANPIGIVIVAVAALVGTLVYFYNTSEKVRGAIKGLWYAAKGLFMGLKEMGMKILGGIGELLMGVFTFDSSKIISGVNSLRSSFSKLGTDVANSFNKGYDIGAKEIKVKNLANAGTTQDPSTVLAGSSGGGAVGAGTPSNIESGLSNISGGGRSVRNVNVNIENMGTGTVINTQTMQESSVDIVRMFEEYLTRAINGAVTAQG